MDPNLATVSSDRLSLIFPDDGLATWITHIAFEARAPGPSYYFSAIPQGRDNLSAVGCTLAMQVQYAQGPLLLEAPLHSLLSKMP